MRRLSLLVVLLLAVLRVVAADDSGHLWLPQGGGAAQVATLCLTPTATAAQHELEASWQGQPVTLRIVADEGLGREGYRLAIAADSIEVSAASDAGLLYAAYALLRRQSMGALTEGIIEERPAIALRLLNHWDNLDGTIERGYAGQSLWEWQQLPDSVSDRYTTYARANAAIGINGTVLNNVNASPTILSSDYLRKVQALADVFRTYNIKVYLAVNFASPMVLDHLPTADPANAVVVAWWQRKVQEIYALIPDFGGFLVKANSEGQPGPCDYGRSHADGANMLAAALQPYGGVVLWRAFVYSPTDGDRAKQAYLEFQPLDGQFRSNVIIQTKNGPFDFQPREPYSPLFSSLRHTALAAELQITQEYLGHANHLVFLAPMWEEFFSFVDATSLTAIAGVANTGSDDNWCGNTFAQANWYAFGRLAWEPHLTAETIANEWLYQTFPQGNYLVGHGILTDIMLASREAVVDYMMPLGLSGLFAWGHHYGPEPWGDIPGAREDWLPRYYHRADSIGIGFDRTCATGTAATAQYPSPLAEQYDALTTCPDAYLLWFHHVPWQYTMRNGQTLWQNLCAHYQRGVDKVKAFSNDWQQLAAYLPRAQYDEGQRMLFTQYKDALWWRDACLLFFQQYSRLPLPDGMRPLHTLDELRTVQLPITNYENPSPLLLNDLR